MFSASSKWQQLIVQQTSARRQQNVDNGWTVKRTALNQYVVLDDQPVLGP